MRRRLLRTGSLALLVIAILAYGGALGYLRLHERAYVYQPGDRHVAAPPAALALHERRVTYPSSGGVTIAAWIIPAAAPRATGQWLLVCHGNYGNVGFGQRPEFYAWMRDLGVNLLAFDYRGFGASSGTPEEQGLYDDASASYEYLVRTEHVPPDRIVIFGHSLGTGVAIELASRRPAAGLIVEGAYTSVVARAQQLYPLLPIALVATQRFASIDRIGRVAGPTLFLHSPEDAIIPFAMGQQLFAAAHEPKRFVAVKGGHENAYSVDREVYYAAVGQLLRQASQTSNPRGTSGPPGT